MAAEVSALEGKLSKARQVNAGHDVRVVDGENTISGKWFVENLSDMDAEITPLETKLSKARDRSCREDGRSRRG